jgi:hypothetical protein
MLVHNYLEDPQDAREVICTLNALLQRCSATRQGVDN